IRRDDPVDVDRSGRGGFVVVALLGPFGLFGRHQSSPLRDRRAGSRCSWTSPRNSLTFSPAASSAPFVLCLEPPEVMSPTRSGRPFGSLSEISSRFTASAKRR